MISAWIRLISCPFELCIVIMVIQTKSSMVGVSIAATGVKWNNVKLIFWDIYFNTFGHHLYTRVNQCRSSVSTSAFLDCTLIKKRNFSPFHVQILKWPEGVQGRLISHTLTKKSYSPIFKNLSWTSEEFLFFSFFWGVYVCVQRHLCITLSSTPITCKRIHDRVPLTTRNWIFVCRHSGDFVLFLH